MFHGKPGSGKDTQAELLASEIPNCKIISGVYRKAILNEGEFAKYHDLLNPHVLPLGKGLKVPGEVVIKIAKEIVEEGRAKGIENFIFCGLLRTPEHFKAFSNWEDQFRDQNDLDFEHIYFDLSDEECYKRSTRRLPAENRVDDSNEHFTARLTRFERNTLPEIIRLELEGKVKTVDASQNLDCVHAELRLALELATTVGERELTRI